MNKLTNKSSFNLEKFYIYNILIMTIFCIGIFFVNFKDSFNLGGGYWDKQVISYVNLIRISKLNSKFIFITNSENVIPIICITLIVSILLYYFHKKKEALFFIINIASISVFNKILKYIFIKQRPSGIRLVEAAGFSFPSGHSITSMTFALLLIYFVIKFVKDKRIKYIASLLIFIYSVLIGMSRVYVGVHYISDVIGAWITAGLWSFISIELYRFKICKCV